MSGRTAFQMPYIHSGLFRYLLRILYRWEIFKNYSRMLNIKH